MTERKNELPSWDEAGDPTPTEAVVTPRSATSPGANVVRRHPKSAIAGSLLIGGIAGAAILGPLSAAAASPSPSDSASPSAVAPAATPGTTPANPAPSTGTNGGDHRAGFGGHNEAVSDTSVVAKAIGISEADLLTALNGGKTVADVAKANNVDVQKVIDALVADGNDELAAAVKAGTITQAQADAEKPNVVQRATDQVNGSFRGGH
jgi:hypothetical protein